MGKSKRSKKTIRETLRRDGYRCRECGSPKVPRVHHTIPLGIGGLDQPSNAITYCQDCHSKQHDSSGSAPLALLTKIGRGILPPEAILTTALWIANSGSIWAGNPSTVYIPPSAFLFALPSTLPSTKMA